MPETTEPENTRPPWKPTGFTWLGGVAVLVILIVASVRAGIGGFFIILSVIALATALYVVVGRHKSWLNISRSAAGAVAAGALVCLVLGSSLFALTSAGQPHLTSVASVVVSDAVGSDVTAAETLFEGTGLHVTLQAADGSAVSTADLAGWIVESQDPPAGQTVKRSSQITLTLRRVEPTPTSVSRSSAPVATPTPTATPAISPSPTPTSVNQFVAPANPAPAAPPAPVAPAPVAPAPAPPAPAPAAPAPATGVVPGAFCPDSEVGQVGVAANGRSYTCGGKGPDANGHYHWNS